MKQTITQWLYMELDSHQQPDEGYVWDQRWAPVIYRFKPEDNETRVFIRSMQIVVDVPDDFDPTARQIAALEAKKAKALEAYVGLVRGIDEQLSKLQAITHQAVVEEVL